jgi:hypothetical protein
VKAELPPTGLFRAGQDFQTQRAKNRGGPDRYSGGKDGACAGPTPEKTWKGQTRALKGDIKSEKAGQPDFQRKYGEDRRPLNKRVR